MSGESRINAARRASVIGDMQRLWYGCNDFRFGQMLSLRVGAPRSATSAASNRDGLIGAVESQA